MNIKERKRRAVELINELLYGITNDERNSAIMDELESIVPDPMVSDHIFYSTEFEREDGSLDIEALVEKCFDYKPNIIAL